MNKALKRICLIVLVCLAFSSSVFAIEPIATIEGVPYFVHSSGRYYYQDQEDGAFYYTNDDKLIAHFDKIVTNQLGKEVVAVTSVEVPAKEEAPVVLTDEMMLALIAQMQKQGVFSPALNTDALPASEPKKGWWETEVEAASFCYDVFFRSVMHRGANFTLGGGLSFGVQTASFQFSLYALGDYYMAPIGGNGGAASLEFSVEAGGTFAWKFMEVWRTRTYICLDVGYYAQFAKIPQQPQNLFMGFNGIMFRPKIYTEIRIVKNYKIGIGLFYQIPLYPAYSDYQGIGVMVSFI